MSVFVRLFDVMFLKCNPHQGITLHTSLSQWLTHILFPTFLCVLLQKCSYRWLVALLHLHSIMSVFAAKYEKSLFNVLGFMYLLCFLCWCHLSCVVDDLVFSRSVVPMQCLHTSDWMSSAVTEHCTLIRLWVCQLMFIFSGVLLPYLHLLSLPQLH